MNERHGFIQDNLSLKILILFILRRLPEPVPLDVLAELTLCDDGISYFDFTECVTELEQTEHVILDNEKYAITEKGVRNCEITEMSLPYSIRQKAEKSSAALRLMLSRDAMIKTSSEPRDDGGLTVNLHLSDGLGDIIAISMFAANEGQAKQLEDGFRESAECVYNRLVEMLLQTESESKAGAETYLPLDQ